MSELSLRPYLRMKDAIAGKGVRAYCERGDISLRNILSSFNMPIYGVNHA